MHPDARPHPHSLQMTFLIYLSHCAVSAFWRLQWNPDNWSIPLITSLADFTGTALLYLLFSLLHFMLPRKKAV